MTEAKLTHKGWMLFCPVYLGDLDNDGLEITVIPRWFWCNPLYWLAVQVQAVVIYLCSFFLEDYEPKFYFWVSGELK